jgi:hypothetical protein
MKERYIILLVLFGMAFILYMVLGKPSIFEGFEYSNTYKASDETIAKITSNANSSNSITVTNADSTTTVYQTSVGDATNKFYNPSGAYATVSSDNKTITVIGANGSTKLYSTSTSTNSDTSSSSSSSSSSDYDNYNHYTGSYYASIYYSSNGNGNTARVIDTGNNKVIIITKANGTSETYYSTSTTSTATTVYDGPNGSTAKIVSDSNGQTTISVTNSDGTTAVYTKNNDYTYSSSVTDNFLNNGNNYSDSLPYGIPGSQIPINQGDMYILKTQIVPPVCPMCPSFNTNTNTSKCSNANTSSNTNTSSNSNSNSNSNTNNNDNDNNNSRTGAASAESWLKSISNSSNNSNSESNTNTTYNPNSWKTSGTVGAVDTNNYKTSSTNIPLPVLSDFSTFGM